jgi:hypothetical protein
VEIRRALTAPRLQAKLTIGSPGDEYEREADRVAEQVTRGSASDVASSSPPRVQRACSCGGSCDKCKEKDEELRRSPDGPAPSEAPRSVHEALRSPGRPLERGLRERLEPRFGADFGGVRIHTDNPSAKDVSARAYTVGNDVVFAPGQYAPGTAQGDRLLAHELTHVVQQSAGPLRLSRDTEKKEESGLTTSSVDIYLDSAEIDFHTSAGRYRYELDQKGLKVGDYNATVKITKSNVDFTLDGITGNFGFGYKVKPGQPNPSTFFTDQKTVSFKVHQEPSPPIPSKEKAADQPSAPDSLSLTPEEAVKRCESNSIAGIKVFPFRGTRFGAAPVSARKDGDDIVVKQPVYVLGNKDFSKQTSTLPTDTFTSGVRLKPNELVRVHVYEPRWYHLNVTGSTSGDIEQEFCVTGQQMLEIAEASNKATLMNIGVTVFEAATLFIPVGKILGAAAKPLAGGARTVTAAAMLGLSDAAPVAAGGAARAVTTMVEEQAVVRVAGHELTQTVAQGAVRIAEEGALETAPKALAGKAASQTLPKAAAGAVVDVAGKAGLEAGAELGAGAAKPTPPVPSPARVLVEGGEGGAGRGLFGKQSPVPSGPVSPEAEKLFTQQVSSTWFRLKLGLYARLTGKGPVNWTEFEKLVAGAEFREYATVGEALQSVGYAGRKETGELVLAVAKPLRKIPVLGKSAAQHELVHVWQEMTSQVITKEAAAKAAGKTVPYIEVLKIELPANVFGGPAVPVTVLVVSGGAGAGGVWVVQKAAEAVSEALEKKK